jgi:hypothetical protein
VFLVRGGRHLSGFGDGASDGLRESDVGPGGDDPRQRHGPHRPDRRAAGPRWSGAGTTGRAAGRRSSSGSGSSPWRVSCWRSARRCAATGGCCRAWWSTASGSRSCSPSTIPSASTRFPSRTTARPRGCPRRPSRAAARSASPCSRRSSTHLHHAAGRRDRRTGSAAAHRADRRPAPRRPHRGRAGRAAARHVRRPGRGLPLRHECGGRLRLLRHLPAHHGARDGRPRKPAADDAGTMAG